MNKVRRVLFVKVYFFKSVNNADCYYSRRRLVLVFRVLTRSGDAVEKDEYE